MNGTFHHDSFKAAYARHGSSLITNITRMTVNKHSCSDYGTKIKRFSRATNMTSDLLNISEGIQLSLLEKLTL